MTDIMLTGCAGGVSPYLCVEHAIPMIVRVKERADHLYAEDPRWQHLDDQFRSFAIRMLFHMSGREYPVVDPLYDNLGMAYRVLINPRMVMADWLGVIRPFTKADIPYEYVEIVQKGFWRAS